MPPSQADHCRDTIPPGNYFRQSDHFILIDGFTVGRIGDIQDAIVLLGSSWIILCLRWALVTTALVLTQVSGANLWQVH